MDDEDSSSDNDTQNSAYVRIPARSIRLLKLVDPNPDGPQLGFPMATFPLDNDPESVVGNLPNFAALSYTWGSALAPHSPSSEVDTHESQHKILLRNLNLEIVNGDAGSEMTVVKYPLQVTQNLQDALIQLWESGYRTNWFWIDAICINQKDNEEKASQVVLMGEIYSRAEAVIVWLGADETDLEDWIWLHSTFFYALGRYIQNFGLEELQTLGPYAPKFLERIEVKPPGGSFVACWHSYMNFCRRRRWFSRAWIVQELVKAQKITFECGSMALPWENIEILGSLVRGLGWQTVISPSVTTAFGRALGDEVLRLSMIRERLLEQVEHNTPMVSEEQKPLEDKMSAVSLNTEEQFNVASSITPLNRTSEALPINMPAFTNQDSSRIQFLASLQRLLFDTRPYSATDPRDKIFSILSMIQESELRLIIPDYSIAVTAQSLYSEIATLLLTELPNLSNLCYVEDRSSRLLTGLPSWVPDYTCVLTPAPFTFIRHEDYPFDCSANDRDKSPTIRSTCTITNTTLKVQATLVDHIVEVCTPMWDILKTQDIMTCLTTLSHLPETYFTGEERGEVLWRTMIANTHSLRPAEPEIGESFKSWASVRLAQGLTPEITETSLEGTVSITTLDQISLTEQLSSILSPFSTSPSIPTVPEIIWIIKQMHRFKLLTLVESVTIQDPNDPFPTLEEQINRIESPGNKFKESLSVSVPFRRLFRTEKGYLGLGPQSAEVGDAVWRLRKAKVPFVLRQSDGSNRKKTLIGESYLHGFMEGEKREGGEMEEVEID